MKDVNGKVAFVTGGASGIGYGIVRTFLAAGMKVVVADIRQDHLDRVAGEQAAMKDRLHLIRLDVTDRAAWIAAADEAERVFGNVHVVCNNAGVGLFGDAKSATYNDWDWGLAVNLGGCINGVHTFLPRLLAHGEGAHIINTTSVAGISPMPGGIVYTTAKHAVTGLTEALRADLKPEDKVDVTLLIPGPVASNIHQVASLRPEKFQSPASKAMEEQLLDREPLKTWMDPLDAGAMVLDAILRQLPLVITHGQFKAGTKNYFDVVLEAFPAMTAEEEKLDLGFGTDNPIYAALLAAHKGPARPRGN